MEWNIYKETLYEGINIDFLKQLGSDYNAFCHHEPPR